MKKILHIAEAFGSGVLNYIKNLSAWQCRNYEVYVAYGIRPETPENFRDQFDPDVHFIKVAGFTREIEPTNDLRAFFFIKKLVREIRPDVIHLHSTKAGVLGRWAVNCNDYHVLYSPHAYSFLMMDCSDRKRKIYRMIEKLSDKKGCLTVTDIDGELEASRDVARHAICIPNGINPSEMDEVIAEADQLREPNRNTTVCMLGKVVPQKDPALFNEIAKAFPNIDFLWIGAGPLEHKLTSPNIRVTGWLSRPEAVARIMESEIFLFPSAWESLSIALLEVMYLGKPCVVSAADGNRDVIRSGENGYVCRAKQEYIKALKTLLSDPSLAEKMGRQAHEDIMTKYNVTAMETAYRELFRQMALDEAAVTAGIERGGVIPERHNSEDRKKTARYANGNRYRHTGYVCMDMHKNVGRYLPQEVAA